MLMTPPASKQKTAVRIMDVAEQLIQLQGYNGFSFHDVARRLGIRSATVHYYYRAKGDLVLALLVRHRRLLAEAMSRISRLDAGARGRVDRLCRLVRQDTLASGGLTLGAMLAAESESLPDPVRAELRACLGDTEAWLARVLAQGQVDGQLPPDAVPPQLAAATLQAALHGIALLSKLDRGVDQEQRLERCLLDLVLGPASPRPPAPLH
jgi:TetR/AcrR family transcriptional repressor of nem operon